MAYHDISNPGFNQQLRMFETTDPVHADTFNAVANQLINNDVALSNALSRIVSDKTEQAKFLLNLHRNGKKYGVHWDAFSANSSSVGTRTEDAVGMVAKPSTNTVRAQNDFENEGPFFHLEVNGSVNTDGTFTVTAIDGIDAEFDRYNKDTWCLYLPYYWKITIGGTGEDIVISDTKYDGYAPEGAAILPDGTVRPFVAMAKYVASAGSSGPASVSGAYIRTDSHNGNVSAYRAKGTQYCAITAQDQDHFQTLFSVAFATRHFQSVMAGCTGYYRSDTATVSETGATSIIVSNGAANEYVVGSVVGIGKSDHDSSIVSRTVITGIETYDGSNKRIKLDTTTSFDTTLGTTRISTFPWKTGACDDVMGSCGSPTSNTSGKEPCVLFGCEMFVGAWEILGNTIFKNNGDGTGTMYICYDCTNISTDITENYVAVGYTVANAKASWQYISKEGFDSNNPSVRFPTELKASSSTGYADGEYSEDLSTTSGLHEVLVRGNLNGGALFGLWAAHLGASLSDSHWYYAARLSASGRSAQRAA